MPHPKLTDKQKQYCAHKHIGMNGQKSALAAGYQPANIDRVVTRLNKNPKIQLELSRLGGIHPEITPDRITLSVDQLDAAFSDAQKHDQSMEGMERQAGAILTRAWIVARQMRTVQTAMGELPTVTQETTERPELDNDDNPILDDNGNPIVRVRRVKTTSTIFNAHAALAGLAGLHDEVDRRDSGGDAKVLEGELAAPRKTVDTDALVAGFRVGREAADG